ncbi:MAG: hypothetical protein L0H83_07060 [Salinisphaera sp.]|nr:hypothetical protein [Salinisphaera sp.]
MYRTTIRGLGLAALSLLWGAALAADTAPRMKTAGPGAVNPSPHRARVMAPELVMQHIAVAPVPATEGDNLNIGFSVKNRGDADSQPGDYVLWVRCSRTGGPGTAGCPFPETDTHPLPAIAQGHSDGTSLLTQPWPAGDFSLSAWVRKAGTGPGKYRPGHSVAIHVAEKPDVHPRGAMPGKAINKKPSVGPGPGPIKPGSHRGFNPQPEPPAGPVITPPGMVNPDDPAPY